MALELLPPDDVPPAGDNDTDVSPLRCEVEGCTNSLTYGGRGRRPTRCDEHKRNKATAGTGNRKKSWPEADKVEESLSTILSWFGAGVAWVNPKDGTVIAKGGPNVAKELVNLAREKKALRPYLQWLAAPGVYGPLLMALATIVLPIMANHNLLPQLIIPMLLPDADSEKSKGGMAA